MNRAQRLFPIDDASQIAEVRRAGTSLAEALGFDVSRAGRVALVITEAATNILKHAERGSIVMRTLAHHGVSGVEVLVIDSGPGISNLALRMEDGNSTVGSYGSGLGTMRRQADEFDLYTAVGGGVAICMRVWDATRPAVPLWPSVGVVCLPMAGEDVCGDAWSMVEAAGSLLVLVADGLGHGPEAARASEAAVAAVHANVDQAPAELMWRVDEALHHTRGAAVGIGRIDLHTRDLNYAGVGNISASIHQAEGRRHMVSHNGIVGSNVRKVQDFGFAWSADTLLVMHSDGVGTRWDLASYPGLVHRHPGVIAAVLYRDFGRGKDDTTLLVLRER